MDMTDRVGRYCVLCLTVIQVFSTSLGSGEPAEDRAESCADGWSEVGGICYKIFGDEFRSTWDEGREFCKGLGQGADLAIFDDDDIELGVIKTDVDAWIGLHWDTDGKKWLWVDGAGVEYADWDYTESVDNEQIVERQPCVYILGGQVWSTWHTYACEGRRPPICQIKAGENPVTVYPTIEPPAMCDGKFSDWHHIGSRCYKLYSEESQLLDWHDARGFCRKYGGELASVHSLEDVSHLLLLVGMNSEPHVAPSTTWIGLRRHSLDPNSDEFFWSDGSIVDFDLWNVGEPSNYLDAESCVQFYPNNGFWNDFNCGVRMAYVCQVCHDDCSVTVKPTDPPPVGHCDEGWDQNGAWCYKIHELSTTDVGFTWLEAKDQCRADGAWLASIHSEEENARLQTMAGVAGSAEEYPGKLWIGFSDFIESDLEFFWDDQSSKDYVKWASGEPDGLAETSDCNSWGFQAADCVAMDIKTGFWSTEDCYDTDHTRVVHAFACKKVSSEPYVTPEPPARCQEPHQEFELVSDEWCLLPVAAEQSWEDAEARCQQYPDSHLVSLTSAAENAVSLPIAVQGMPRAEHVWLGLSFNEKFGEFQWSDGRPMVYSNWAPSEPPANDTASLCAAMSTETGTWSTRKCRGDNAEKYAFLCKFAGPITPATPSPLEDGLCQEGWLDGGHEYCYTVGTTESFNFEQAKISCQEMGSTLASIHSISENQKLVQLIRDYHLTSAFVGFAGSAEDGFTWDDGTEVNYENWGEGQPDGDDNFCVVVKAVDGKWDDSDCDQSYSFICKQLKVPDEGDDDDEDGRSSTGKTVGLAIGVVCLVAIVLGGGGYLGLLTYRRFRHDRFY